MNAIMFKVMKNTNYSVISNRHIFRKDMSWEAKGMLDAMLSVPDNWQFSIEGLVRMSSNGKASVRSILKELTELGYIRIEQGRNAKGQITSVYYIYEEPIAKADEGSDPDQNPAPSDGSETPTNSASESTVSAMSENRTWCENQTTSENRMRMNHQIESSDSSDSPSTENRIRSAVCGQPHTVFRTQLNNNTKYRDINNNIYNYNSTAPNVDTYPLSSVSTDSSDSDESTDSMSEEKLLVSLKERIGYDWLIMRHRKETLDLLLSLMIEVYRTDRRQIRIGGVLRSVKEVRTQFDLIGSDHMVYILNCYASVSVPVRSLRAYLLTTLYNAPLSFREYTRKEEEQAEYACFANR